MKKTLKVILLIETTHGYGRNLIRGIGQYSKLHGPWSFLQDIPFYGRGRQLIDRVSELRKINADGIIVREPNPEKIKQLMKLEIPMITSPSMMHPNIPAIINDTMKIGKLAAQHFLEKGFTNFAYCGFEAFPWSLNRYECFANTIEQKNRKVHSYFSTVDKIMRPKESDQAKLVKWLQSLPKPVGLMTCNDDMGRLILEVCNNIGIPVPGKIAVVGVDNDDLTCELTDPPLSSISLHSENAGYQAAELLDRLMHGEKMNGQIIHQEPTDVVLRQSSDVIAVDDRDVAQALEYIRQHFNEPITVNDVANEVHMSRRHLYKKFTETIGHSASKEIKNIRIKHICKLLLETDLSIYQITMSLGFTGIEHISRYFQKEKGLSPQEFRNKFRRL